MKTRKWKKNLLTFVLIGALLGVQVMELVAYAAETGTDALEPSVVCSNYSQLYSAIIQAQDGDVIGINDTIIVGGNVNNVLGDTDKHVTIVRMNQLAVLYLSHSGTFTIQNITFDGNGIDSGNNMILVNNSCIMNDVTVQNCSMSLYYGAAVQVLGGTTTMNRCTFKNNIANEGGHIAVMNDSVLNMTECILTEGQAGQNGGAIYYNSSAAQYGEISSSVIHANSAGSSGGGIYVASGNLVLNSSVKLYGNTAPKGEDMTSLVTGQGCYSGSLEEWNILFAEDNIRVNGLEMTQDPDTATKYYKLYYEEIVQEQPGDSEDPDDTGDDTTDPTTPGEGDSTDEPSTEPDEDTTDPSVPGEDEGDDNQEDTTQPGDSDQDSTEDPDAGDSDDSGQAGTEGGGNTDNSSNNGNTTNTTENSGNTTNTDNSSNDTTVDNSSNDVVTDNSDHSSTDNSQTDNSQTTTDNSDHSTTTNTSDNSSHDTNTTTTNNSSDNSSKTTTTDNSQRSEDNSSVVTTYNYYQNPENQSQVQQGQQMQPIVVNNYIQPSQEGQQVEEADDPSNNIKIDAEGVDVVFEMVDGVYSISIKAANEPQAVQTVQDAVVPASNQAAEPAFNVNWYEIIKIGLLVAILVNVMWKPRQNSPA